MKECILVKHLYNGFYNWCIECGHTAHLSINASELTESGLPEKYLIDELMLNVSPDAVGSISITDEGIDIDIKISGQPHTIQVPWRHVRLIGSKETAHILENVTYGQDETSSQTIIPTVGKRPHLTLVK